jgi:hypothetical protein
MTDAEDLDAEEAEWLKRAQAAFRLFKKIEEQHGDLESL